MPHADHYPKLYFYQRIVQAKLFIDRHYADNIELFNIAAKAFYSQYHFIRQFKKTYQQTPHQYLMTLRVQHAMKLLATDMSVADVAGMVGFKELSSFSRLFKCKVGINPSTYQAQKRAFKQQIDTAPLTFIPHCFAFQYGLL